MLCLTYLLCYSELLKHFSRGDHSIILISSLVLVSEFMYSSVYAFCPFSVRENETLCFSCSWLAKVGRFPHQLIPVHLLYNPMALRSPLALQEEDLQSESVFPPSYCMEPG